MVKVLANEMSYWLKEHPIKDHVMIAELALNKTRNRGKAAKLLNIDVSDLNTKIKQWGLFLPWESRTRRKR